MRIRTRNYETCKLGKQAHAAWILQREEGAASRFEALELDRPPQQKV